MARAATQDSTHTHGRRWSNGKTSPLDDLVTLEQAKRSLRDHNTTESVADEAGYASVSGFSNAFRRKTGVTPTAWYRKNVRNPR